MNIRPFRDSDLEAVVVLFTDSVHLLAAEHYSEAQRLAWAPLHPDRVVWKRRMASTHTLMAEVEGHLAGFISYELDGHIEYLYSSPRFSHRGIASRLYEYMERHLDSLGVTDRFTEASLVARPFFERQGLRVVEEQNVKRDGVVLRRFSMKR